MEKSPSKFSRIFRNEPYSQLITRRFSFFRHPAAIAGVTVGSVLLVTFLVIWLLFAIRRAKRRREMPAEPVPMQTEERRRERGRSMLMEDNDWDAAMGATAAAGALAGDHDRDGDGEDTRTNYTGHQSEATA